MPWGTVANAISWRSISVGARLHVSIGEHGRGKLVQSADVFLYLWFNADEHWPRWVVQLIVWAGVWVPKALMAGLAVLALIRPEWRRVLWLAMLSLALTWVMVRVFRTWLPMPRPASLDLGVQWLAQGERPGFPSMHAAGSFAVAMVMLLLRGGWLAWFYLGAGLLVSLSRLVLGLHFPLDIAVGALLGSLVAVCVAGVAQRALLPWRASVPRRKTP